MGDLRTEGETWKGFESIRAIPGLDDDILLVPLTGHTRGHSGVAVNTEDGWRKPEKSLR